MTRLATVAPLRVQIFFVLAARLFGQVVDARWSQPFEHTAVASERGYIVADNHGNSHMIWVERRSVEQGAILWYTGFDGYSWSQPIQVYVSRPGFRIGPQSLTCDRSDNLHLAWTESDIPFTLGDWPAVAPIVYTRVRAAEATVAQSWSSPKTIRATAVLSTLRVDAAGTLHLVYTDSFSQQPGVLYVRSDNGGESWSDPFKLDSEIPKDHYPFFSQLELDGSGGLHVAWEYKVDWRTMSIFYRRSRDGGRLWFDPISLDNTSADSAEIQYGHPLIAVQNQTIHVVWTGGGFINVGRRHRYSTDAGQSWSNINQLFRDLHGFVSSEALVHGPDGRLHFLDQMRYPMGLYHSSWAAGQWSEPTLVYMIQEAPGVPMADRIHVHRVNVAVSRDQLVATFTTENLASFPLILFSIHTQKPIVRPSHGRSYVTPGPVSPQR